MSESSVDAHEELAYALAVQACLWGRPLMEYAITTEASGRAGGARINGFRYFDDLKTADDRFVVTPNNVSIDGYAELDLRDEPVVLSVPALPERRWYIVQLSDMFDEIVQNIGGAAGPEPGLYAVVGPNHHGPVPAGMRPVRVRTLHAASAVRVFVAGTSDLEAARVVQRSVRLMPLSQFEQRGLSAGDDGLPQTGYLPGFEPSGPEELRTLEHIGFAMHRYLPASAEQDDPFVHQLRRIGLSVQHGLMWEDHGDSVRRGLARAIPAAEAMVDWAYGSAATVVDGWRYTSASGRAGHDWAVRAGLVKYVLGANVPEQLVYPDTPVDADGEPLDGAHAYELRFAPGHLPPVSVLWNLAMYDEGKLFVPNDFGRFSIGSTTDGVTPDADGGLTLRIQHAQPDSTANWLPAPPSGPFTLTMRLYGAGPSYLNGSWRLPAVVRVA